jgi:shikimate dehydrogenase
MSSRIGWERSYRIPGQCDVVVNASSIGLPPDLKSRLDLDLLNLRFSPAVAEIIPDWPRTRLVREADLGNQFSRRCAEPALTSM